MTTGSSTLPPEITAAAGRGWRLFPVKANGKQPLIEEWPTIATCDLAQLEAWAAQSPACNWGLATGKASGLFVIDVDGLEGRAALEELARQGLILPETLAVTTGRADGGEHRYYRMPDGMDIRNDQNRRIAHHIDVRGTGGFVVVPPSVHETGKRYTFIDPDASIVDAPQWLITRLTGKTSPQAAPAPATGTLISKGGRTNRMVSLAGTLHKRGAAVESIEALLLAENSARCEPPLPEEKVRAIARDVPARYPNPPNVQGGNGLKLVGLSDLLSRPPSPVDWMWGERLAAGTMSMLASKPKTGKSTLARNLCLAVARGESFLGAPCRRGPVLYMALEERLEDVASDFPTLGADGSEDIQLADAGAVGDLLTLLLDTKPALLVIDPLFRLVNVRDEKAYAEVYAALGPLIDTARACGTHILALHHSSKMAKAEAIDAPIGSTALGGAVSTLLIMRRTEAYRTLETVQRLGHDLQETVLHFDAATKQLTLGGSREQAEVDNVAPRILAVLGAGSMTEKEIDDAVEGRTEFLRKALRNLVESGKITRTGAGKKSSPYLYQDSRFLVPAPIKNIGNKQSEVAAVLHSEKVVPDIHSWCGNKQTRNAKNPESGEESSAMLVPELCGEHAHSQDGGNEQFRRMPL